MADDQDLTGSSDTGISDQQQSPSISYIRPKVPSTNPLLRLIGGAIGKTPMEYGNPVAVTNQQLDHDTLKKSGIMPPTVAGQDANGNNLYELNDYNRAKQDVATYQKMSMLTGMRMDRTNPIYTTPDEIEANSGGLLKVADGSAQAYLDANRGSSSKVELGQFIQGKGVQTRDVLADSLKTRSNVQLMNFLMKASGGDAMQKAAGQANMNLLAAKKAQALIGQIQSAGGQATIQQQNELGASLGQLAGSGQGQLTDEKMNAFIPNTAAKKFGGWQQYFANKFEPVDFTGFLPQMSDLVNREMSANQEFANNASQMGASIANQVMPGLGNKIGHARQINPIANPSGSAIPNMPGQRQGLPDVPSGNVRMKRQDGTLVDVPAAKVIAARKAGYMVAQ